MPTLAHFHTIQEEVTALQTAVMNSKNSKNDAQIKEIAQRIEYIKSHFNNWDQIEVNGKSVSAILNDAWALHRVYEEMNALQRLIRKAREQEGPEKLRTCGQIQQAISTLDDYYHDWGSLGLHHSPGDGMQRTSGNSLLIASQPFLNLLARGAPLAPLNDRNLQDAIKELETQVNSFINDADADKRKKAAQQVILLVSDYGNKLGTDNLTDARDKLKENARNIAQMAREAGGITPGDQQRIENREKIINLIELAIQGKSIDALRRESERIFIQ